MGKLINIASRDTDVTVQNYFSYYYLITTILVLALSLYNMKSIWGDWYSLCVLSMVI